MLAQCPCGVGAYATCCGPLHHGAARAQSAEQLMRSRFSAFVLGLPDYLVATWHPRTRPESVDTEGMEWISLEILDTVDGEEGDETGIVEFIARHDRGEMRERSAFARRAGRWFYVEAVE